jgi:hypothetical protein
MKGKMMATERKTMKASEVIAAMQQMVQQHGDREVFFSDGYFRYGVTTHPESAPNYDSSKAFLVKAFNLETGKNGPDQPLHFRAA